MRTEAWVPAALKCTPTMRVRDYVVYKLQAGTLNPAVLLLAPQMTNVISAIPGLLSNQYYGVFGAGATAGNAGALQATGQVSTVGPGRYRLHRMGITVVCTGPAAGNLLPNSHVRMGCLASPIDPISFPTYNSIATYLTGRPELHTFTGYSLMTCPRHIAAYPVDRLDWATLKSAVLTSIAATNFEPADTLSQIVLYISTTNSGLEDYQITVHGEWDVLPADDSNPVLSSAINQLPSLPERIVDDAITAARTVTGVFEKGEAVAAGIGNAVKAVQGFTNEIGRASCRERV